MLINNKIKKFKNNRKIINFKPKILLKKKYNNKIIKMNKNQKIMKMVFLCYNCQLLYFRVINIKNNVFLN